MDSMGRQTDGRASHWDTWVLNCIWKQWIASFRLFWQTITNHLIEKKLLDIATLTISVLFVSKLNLIPFFFDASSPVHHCAIVWSLRYVASITVRSRELLIFAICFFDFFIIVHFKIGWSKLNQIKLSYVVFRYYFFISFYFLRFIDL